MPSTKRSQDTLLLDKAHDSKKTRLDFENLKPMQTLYVKNLNTKINKQIMIHNLYLLFSAFGDVISINLKQGFGFIIFASVSLATLALRTLQNEEFFDKSLVINYVLKESKIITRAKNGIVHDTNGDDGAEGNEEDILPLYE